MYALADYAQLVTHSCKQFFSWFDLRKPHGTNCQYLFPTNWLHVASDFCVTKETELLDSLACGTIGAFLDFGKFFLSNHVSQL